MLQCTPCRQVMANSRTFNLQKEKEKNPKVQRRLAATRVPEMTANLVMLGTGLSTCWRLFGDASS